MRSVQHRHSQHFDQLCFNEHLFISEFYASSRHRAVFRTPLSLSFVFWFCTNTASNHLKLIPCEFTRQQQSPWCQHSPHSKILLLQGSARPWGGMDPDPAGQELVLPGGLLSPANKPMRSINSQPEKASLTLCSSAQVDSLLLLVIWVCRKKQKSVRTLIFV